MSDTPAGAAARPSVAQAIERISTASDVMNTVVPARSDVEMSAARGELSRAVGAARDLDVSWQTIGDALGMRRGAAYQRFRQRPASRSLEIHESPIDGVTVLAIRGELDALNAPQVVEAVGRAVTAVPMGLIVDLSQLTFLSTAGMTALADGDRVAGRAGKQFGVVADGSSTERPMRAMDLDGLVNLYPTVHEAMIGLHALAGDDLAG